MPIVNPKLLTTGIPHLEHPQLLDEGTTVHPSLPSCAWKDSCMLNLEGTSFSVKHEETSVEPWKDTDILHLNDPAFSIKHEPVDGDTSTDPSLLPSAWNYTGVLHQELPACSIEHQVVDERTSVLPCLPSSTWNDTWSDTWNDAGILHLEEPGFVVEHDEVVDEGTTLGTSFLPKDTGILHLEEPAFAIKHEPVDDWTTIQPCFLPNAWNHSTILHPEDRGLAIQHGAMDEVTNVEPCLWPSAYTSMLHLKEPAFATEHEVVDEGNSVVQPNLLPNAGKDTNRPHLEEPAFAIKHEVVDEGTSVEPCLPPSIWKDTGVSHLKEPAFTIKHELVDEEMGVEPCLQPSAEKDAGTINREEPAFVFKHEGVDEGISAEPCLPPNHLSPPNLVRKEPSRPSRKRLSPVSDFSAGLGRKSTRLGDTRDKHSFQCESISNINVENLETDVNQIVEEPDANNTLMDKVQQGKRRGVPEGSFKADKGAFVGRIKQVPLSSKTNEIKVQGKNSKDINDEHEKATNKGYVGSNKCNASSNKSDARRKVRDTLRLFHGVLRKLVQAHEKKKMGRVDASLQIIAALKIFKDHGKYINTKKMMGPIPGVEIGDLFNYRVELDIIGLHKPLQSGIDFIKQDDKIFAISVVASGRYDNDVVNCDLLIYTGQGGNVAGGCKQLEDQKLERGNLALKNSIYEKNLVRVIRGFKERKMTGGIRTTTPSYIYDGLYTVQRYWHESGRHGKLIYKFELKRVPHQPELTRNIVKQSKKSKIRKGSCKSNTSKGKEASVCGDISQGKETTIFAVNDIDDEKPPSFTYITEVMYPDWCRPIPPKGCDCKDGCLVSKHCACSLKNGGEIPYNHSGAIVEEKSLVYECGPSCKCPPTCHNRVSQHGIKLPLEVFKTESRGWAVRCLSSISSGTFVCEYIGELLDDKEAEQRIGSDDYLFDIGKNYNDPTLREGLSALIPHMQSNCSDVVENVGFTLDAGNYGNVGRFINHSCTPNLFAQNVLYDHEDKRIPHIMFYAAENIPPLRELTYHYNYKIDQVLDSEGNIKRKSCYCGSSECTGRMY